VWALSYPARVMEDAYEIREGDCREVMRGMDAESIDAIVCDPPYGLSFMGKGWDHGVPGVEFWTEAMRVAKPGAHLLAFGGTRTYHRLACAIEDAGWEIRDCVMWVYGSGFPKSHDVSKAIDKCNGEPHRLRKFTAWMRSTGLNARQLDQITSTNMGGHYLTAASQPAIPTAALWELIRPYCGDIPPWVDTLVERIEAEREVVGEGKRQGGPPQPMWSDEDGRSWDITAPATDAARQWSGWGTALKPAWEPIIVARKPLVGTVAENVIAHGTGAINVDGCRVGDGQTITIRGKTQTSPSGWVSDGAEEVVYKTNPPGRWPANLIHDGSDEVVGLFPQTTSGALNRANITASNGIYGAAPKERTGEYEPDSGSAARFFYCAKASKRDRDEGCDGLPQTIKQSVAHGDKRHGTLPYTNEPREMKPRPRGNHHPTVKPTALMRYLCRLVTPPGGTVLDPFMGSGSTGKAAMLEGFRFIGIEREAEYVEIAKARIRAIS
jgi:DNA modification methylase